MLSGISGHLVATGFLESRLQSGSAQPEISTSICPSAVCRELNPATAEQMAITWWWLPF
jgi:hypothetical protein